MTMEKLDEQFDDLNRALETLTGAIKQIDDESKSRFSETFEKVNAGLIDFEVFKKIEIKRSI